MLLIVGQMSIKAVWWDASLDIFSWSSKHCIQLSTTNLSLHYCNVCISEAVVQSCFLKKLFLKLCKIHRCFLWHRSFLWILCNFKEHLFCRTPSVVASGICNNRYFPFYGETKDFIFTCTFLRIITFFIKI